MKRRERGVHILMLEENTKYTSNLELSKRILITTHNVGSQLINYPRTKVLTFYMTLK